MSSAAQKRAKHRDDEAEAERIFGNYRIVGELGRGGMARVYEANHLRLGHRVALKLLNPELGAQKSAAARFIREAKALSRVRHQNVVQVLDVGMERGRPFIVMEFLDGLDLARMLVARGPLPPSGIADVFLPVLSAVSAAHASGVIHRDLKPANIMLVRRPPEHVHPVVLDFGISKFIEGETAGAALTHSETLLGTIQYLAPELAKGASLASPLSDQYALGVMLYECATGERPFKGGSHYELIHAILTQSVLPPSAIRPELPRSFDDVVLRALQRNPEDRYPSLAALGSELLSFGSKRTWAIWEREFVTGAVREDGPWQAPALTFAEEPSLVLQSRRRPATSRLGSGARWAAALITAYAVGITLAYLNDGRAVPTARATAAPRSPHGPVHERSHGARASAVAIPALAAASTSVESSELAPVASQEASVAHRAKAGERLETTGTRRASAPPKPVPAISVGTGTNGALILE